MCQPGGALVGIAHLCLGIPICSLQDVIIKLVSGACPVTAAIAIRSVVAFPILTILLAQNGEWGLLLMRQVGWVLLRALILMATCIS